MKELIDAINKLFDSLEDGDWVNLGLLPQIRKIRRLMKRERR